MKISPQEKARELFDKFHEAVRDHSDADETHAKRCALICIDEIVDSHDRFLWDAIFFQYWEIVKSEVELL